MTRPTDPLYASQWHLGSIGDLESIWSDYDGTSVSVGIYDDGIEYSHADLSANYDASLTFSYGGTTYNPFPISTTDAHGTAVAGIIAAAQNSSGGSGVAPGAGITGINFLEDIQFKSQSIIDAAFAHGTNFDVISNSWGVTPLYGQSQNLTVASSQASSLDASFQYLATTGRGGLGTSVVKAAGNENRDANADGTDASRYNIVVAATDQSGNAASYSNWGSNILVAAPAASVTTDRSGNNGYNAAGSADGDTLANTDYTSVFGGTSAATPVVTGVISLMYDAAPGLGWRDVKSILATSASITGSTPGSAAQGTEDGAWLTNGADDWNGGGRVFHVNYGYGQVDAHAAVRMAEVWSEFSPSAATSATESSINASYTGSPVATADASGSAGITDVPVTVAQSLTVETIQVTVSMTHSWATDVELQLIAPDGTAFQIMDRPSNNNLMRTGFDWTFSVEAARGMDSAGTWNLRVIDHLAGDSGQISAVSLSMNGAAASADDVYHLTDDYLTLKGVEPARATLTDADGGTDWLNMAAVTGGISATIGNGGSIAVAGQTWASIGASANFENLVAGDGSDTISGSGAANRLMGMRGNDHLSGGGGNDILEGGAGADTLVGDGGNDWLNGNSGTDTLTGGTGADLFVYDSLAALTGSVADFSAADGDKVLAIGDAASLSLSASGGNVSIGGLMLAGAATGDVAVDLLSTGSDVKQSLGGDSAVTALLAGGTLGQAGSGYHSIQFDADDNASWLRVDTDYNSADQPTFRTTGYDDGTSAQTVYDAQSTQAYQYYVTSYDSGGTRTVASYSWDTGRTQIVDYAGDGTTITRQTEIFADATRTVTTYDAAGSSWNTIQDQYDSGGTRFYKDVVYDDGARTRTYWDTGTQPHDYIIEEFNAASQQTGKTVSYDDGSVLNVVYSGGSVWYQTQINTDGTRVVTSYDHTGANSWSAINEYRNLAGDLTLKQVFYDDNTRIYTSYDLAANSWDSIAQTYDANGAIDQKQVNYDAGNWTITDYDQNNQFSWASHVMEYASDGSLTNDYYV